MSSVADTPQAYLDSEIEFMGRKIKVDKNVLIPRIETEQLVNEVLKLDPKSVVDVGTGSGCIAVILAKNLPDAEIYATDISEEALKVAKQNADELEITFFKTNLLTGVPQVEVIVANLPYVPTQRISTLDSSVKDFEPHLALDGGADGFYVYRELFGQIAEGFRPRFLLAEIDDTQGELAKDEVWHHFPHAKSEIIKDMFGRDRILKVSF